MLNRIIDFSLKNRPGVITGAILLLFTGAYVTSRMEIDIFPELTAPTVVIMTEAGGMAPEEVEMLVTFPIETGVNGASSVRRVRSFSTMGFSLVFAEFEWGTDIFRARQTISERLIRINDQLPAGIDQPVIAPQTSVLGEMMIIAMESDSLSPMDLRTIADWSVAPRLLSTGGVAQVTVIGGEPKEYQILADPYKLNYYGITMEDLKKASVGLNANTSGGFLNQYGNKYVIRGVARTNTARDIANSVIAAGNANHVRIGDVAIVKSGTSPSIGTASYRGKNAVLITITRQPDANTVELSDRVESVLDDLSGNIPSVKFHTDIYNQASFIRTSVKNVLKALIEGGVFVVIVLFFFLFSLRTTLISLLAIPLSLLVTVISIKALGYTINTMSLGGMAIAIGSLVDDAIIDVENIFRRLRQNINLPAEKRESTLKIVFLASSEMRSSIWNATLIIIITFVPLFFLRGFEGRMLRPLGISFMVSLAASLLVAITITPVLSSYLLSDERILRKSMNGSWTERNLRTIYTRLLEISLKRKRMMIILTSLLLAFSVYLITTTGTSFLPPFNEGALTVNISTLPGISLEESARIGIRAQEILLKIPEIRSVSCKTGRAELAEHSFGENVSELDVPFGLKDRSRDAFFADVRGRLKELKGVNIEVGQPISHRIDNMLSGSKANIVLKVFGDDLNDLYSIANEIRAEIAGVEGIGDLNVEQLVETPEIKIRPRREMLVRYGIEMSSFNSFVSSALAGEKISDVYEDEKRFPLVLRYNDETRGSITGIRNAMIDTNDEKKVPLSFVADIESSSGPGSISRENVRRRIVISVNVAGRDVGSVVKDIKEKVKSTITLPVGYQIEYSGQFENAERAAKRLILASILAIVMIFMLLYQEFRDSSLAAVILLNLPLALIGGIFAIKLSSDVTSIPSIIGFITLFGIATRNGILLVSRYIHLEKNGFSLRDSVITGSAERLNPILMTALTAALALIPLAAGGDKPGNEIQSPMAIVILGGLLTSTLLNIFVIPSVYTVIRQRKNPENKRLNKV